MLAELLSGVALLCNGQLAPPSPDEQRAETLRTYVEQRAQFGFRADRAYVRRLARQERRMYGFPVTAAEGRYLRQRNRLQLESRVQRYISARPAVSGGVSIEDGWPGKPYWLVRVTADATRHRAAMRKLSRFPVRVRRVAHSERSLRRLQDSIDFDAPAADGFQVSSTSVDIERNAVAIELITDRKDHREYFRARYGRLVRTFVIATRATELACSKASAYQPVSGGLRLHWITGGGAELERVEVTEHPGRVEVGIVERIPNGPRTQEARAASTRVDLTAPLGDREVVDAATGLRLRRGSHAFGR
jgi:hypothetical protein